METLNDLFHFRLFESRNQLKRCLQFSFIYFLILPVASNPDITRIDCVFLRIYIYLYFPHRRQKFISRDHWPRQTFYLVKQSQHGSKPSRALYLLRDGRVAVPGLGQTYRKQAFRREKGICATETKALTVVALLTENSHDYTEECYQDYIISLSCFMAYG